MPSPTSPVQYQLFHQEKTETINAHLPTEAPVSLTVNGAEWLTFMCTPTQLEALAIGFLHNEGIIQDFSEVAGTHLCKNNENVDVWLYHAAEKPEKWTRTTGCAGGQTSAATNVKPEPAHRLDNIELSPAQIPELLAMLNDDQSLYRQTGGVHTSVLTDGEKKLLSAEDIGRHNTLDKIAGQMLMEGIKPKSSALLTTGRISSEMMQKSIRMGASAVISRTSPSSLSVKLAQEAGITLIGYARRHRFNLYTGNLKA